MPIKINDLVGKTTLCIKKTSHFVIVHIFVKY